VPIAQAATAIAANMRATFNGITCGHLVQSE
jgi:hypothetical protein